MNKQELKEYFFNKLRSKGFLVFDFEDEYNLSDLVILGANWLFASLDIFYVKFVENENEMQRVIRKMREVIREVKTESGKVYMIIMKDKEDLFIKMVFYDPISRKVRTSKWIEEDFFKYYIGLERVAESYYRIRKKRDKHD